MCCVGPIYPPLPSSKDAIWWWWWWWWCVSVCVCGDASCCVVLGTADTSVAQFEGRDLVAIHIKGHNGTASKPKFWFDALIHSREWITGATVIYMLNEMITKYGSDQVIVEGALSKRMHLHLLMPLPTRCRASPRSLTPWTSTRCPCSMRTATLTPLATTACGARPAAPTPATSVLALTRTGMFEVLHCGPMQCNAPLH